MAKKSQNIESDEEIELEVEEIDEDRVGPRFGKYDISSYPADYTITTILDKYDKSIIVPEFQRRYVWSKDIIKQSRLIESLLLGLPVPQIFLFQRKNDKNLLIIDGFQRLNTINKFYNNEFALEGVHPQWNGKKYTDFLIEDREQLDNATIRAIIVRQVAPDDNYTSMYHIFERLNTGGMVLSPMEIRKAIAYGPFYKELEKLNLDPNWQSIINRKTTEYRLRDIEWILRIFALSEMNSKIRIEDSLKEFLTEFMTRNKDNTFEKKTARFKDIAAHILSEIGSRPFHVPKGRLNLSVLDSVFATLLKTGKISNLNAKYKQLLADMDFKDIIQTRDATRKAVIDKRLGLAFSYLK